MKTRAFNRRPVAQAISIVLGSTVLGTAAFAQQANQGAAETLDEVVVTGIRGSLTSSMNLKREAQGVVDGIVAEDIGKFPDTNLAESLQRITGVSIDRSIGEGSKITVRGIGPDYNLVLLNGRQMPGATIGDTFASNSRSFDFANLASEAIAGVEVYKTSRASTSTGGIGASVNIKTTRPLDAPGTRFNFGVKGVIDQSATNTPSNIEGDTITPEISGIYSQTSDDGMWGIAVTASYQERDAGYNQASVGNGWRPFGADQGGWGSIPQDSPNIVNRPDGDDIYSVPQNLGYGFNSIERKRTNGQATFQFKPTDALTATLDYTYSENKVHTRRNELSVWFNFGASGSTWTDGPVAAPLQYTEFYTFADNPNTPFVIEGGSDVSMGGADYATRNENNSVGFNLEYEVSDKLGLELDYHSSKATSGADSPFGSNAVLGVASLIRGTTTADFSKDFPVISIVLPDDYNGQLRPSMNQVTGSSFRNSYTKAEVEQTRLSGKFELTDSSKLDFGVGFTEVNNRSAFSNVQSDTWGGVPGVTPELYPDDIWQLNTVRGFFDNIDGSSNTNLFNQFFSFNFQDVIDLLAPARAANNDNPLQAYCGLNGDTNNLVPCYEASSRFGTDRRTNEKSTSAYVQYSHSWEGAVPIHMALGVRYEQTDVTSSALVPIALAVTWTANNEFPVQFGTPDFTTLKGDYSYVLPSADFAFDLMDNLKLRASVGKSIGRPGWGDIQGGQTLSALARIDGGTGSQGDPSLKPLESLNYDLSVEWYYAESSYASVGYFRKDIDNYIGVTTIEETPFNLPHPGPGAAYYDEAEAACPGTGDLTCIRAFILTNHDGDPGVNRGDDVNGQPAGIISGVEGDPLAVFTITVPSNQRSAEVDGFEVAIQHMFGSSGFGLQANATFVNSNLSYDNHSTSDQFAIEGLSDSANFIAFYERDKWSVRAAYNWRDEFLAGRFDGTGGPNPVYVDPYGQFDLNASFSPSDSLTFSIEAINLTDEIQRVHGRADRQALYVTQTGTRYMIGARYKFQ